MADQDILPPVALLFECLHTKLCVPGRAGGLQLEDVGVACVVFSLIGKDDHLAFGVRSLRCRVSLHRSARRHQFGPRVRRDCRRP